MDLVFSGPAGDLEGVLELPEAKSGRSTPRAAAVVCHPHPLHGGTLRNTVVFRTARALRATGLATLRFNFRGVEASQGRHDGKGGEEEDLAAALELMAERFPGLPLWAGGFSFGARTVCGYVNRIGGVERVVLVALPSAVYDCSCAASLETPGLAVFGSEDEFGTLEDFRRRVPAPAQLELEEIDGADHFFRGRTPILEETIRAYAERALPRNP